MNKILKVLFFIFAVTSLVFAGWYLAFTFQNKMMGKYDLYNCIWNNAESNSFSQNLIMIQKIQDECICFREHNYTNLLEVDCSK